MVLIAKNSSQKMSATIMEAQLFKLLSNGSQLAARGYAVQLHPENGITIFWKGRHHGRWSWHGTHFRFTPADRAAPTYAIETAVEALLYTRNVVCASRSKKP